MLFCGGRELFSPKNYFFKDSLYVSSSFTEAHTKYPKGKGMRELPNLIVEIIKKKSKKVLENGNPQCQSTGIFPGLMVHHEVHNICTCLLCVYTSEYAYACILVWGQYIYLLICYGNQKEILSVSCSISQPYCIEVKTH